MGNTNAGGVVHRSSIKAQKQPINADTSNINDALLLSMNQDFEMRRDMSLQFKCKDIIACEDGFGKGYVCILWKIMLKSQKKQIGITETIPGKHSDNEFIQRVQVEFYFEENTKY